MTAPVFVFVGAKGGTGTSTVCAELAKAMRDEVNVVLVDADLNGRRTAGIMFDAVRHLDTAHDQQGRIASARVNGITLVELASSYEASFTLTLDEVERTAAALQDSGTVLVDAPLPFSALVRPLIMRLTRAVVVTEPTLLGATAARTMVAQLRHFGVPLERIALVIDGRSDSGRVNRSEIEHNAGVPVIADLPNMSDRGFARGIASLRKTLHEVKPEIMLTGLFPSESGQTRDRRSAAIRVPTNGHSRTAQVDEATLTPRDQLKLRVHDALAKNVDLLDAARVQGDAAKLAELRQKINDVTQQIIAGSAEAQGAEAVAQLKEEIVNEALGLGPIEDFMHDPDVTEIMVNGPSEVYVEKGGIIYHTPRYFASEQQLRLIIERIIAPLGRRLDESSPMVDARLSDGSRVNAIIEPLTLTGTTLTIRRFGLRRLTADDLLAKGSATPEIMDFIRACVEARLNIVISGGTGSGKTTFLNILSSYLPKRERIVTIEDAAELLLNQPHWIRLESRPPNLEGRGQVAIRDLVRNALRMRPDRIVVGECRGPEALDMLQAMNTGHDGSLTTIHANSARDALSRIETMVLMAGYDLPVRAIREQI
ncbi:MAG TPA: ATPase, T2SS/T4P/T4SS family, partial [Candidatus Baltobacteraceae bacterium]|nr:ATPase, T2SS/T4P/T4SS family [Candidatus Baltobacteraceae bacterium]